MPYKAAAAVKNASTEVVLNLEKKNGKGVQKMNSFDDMSEANGTLTLLGDWTQEAINGLNAVLKVWALFEDHLGICAKEEASLEKNAEEVTEIGNEKQVCGCDFRPLHPIISITMSDYVTKIDCRFQNPDDQLRAITLSRNLKKLRGPAYAHCTHLEKALLPEGITVLEDGTFYWRSRLSEVRLPEKLEEIGEEAFWQCSSLKNVQLPASLRKIGARAFRRCKSLDEITIPEVVEVLEKETFAGCAGLRDVTLPASVKKMTKGVFKGCTSGLTLHAPAGSYAEKFAVKNGFSFTAV